MEEGVTVEYVWMILRMDLVSLLSRGRRGERKSKIQLGLVSLMYIALGVGTYYGAYRLFDYLESNLAPVPGMADAVAVNIFNGLAIYVLVIVFLSLFRPNQFSQPNSLLLIPPSCLWPWYLSCPFGLRGATLTGLDSCFI